MYYGGQNKSPVHVIMTRENTSRNNHGGLVALWYIVSMWHERDGGVENRQLATFTLYSSLKRDSTSSAATTAAQTLQEWQYCFNYKTARSWDLLPILLITNVCGEISLSLPRIILQKCLSFSLHRFVLEAQWNDVTGKMDG